MIGLIFIVTKNTECRSYRSYPAAREIIPSPLYWSRVGVEIANPLFRQKNIIGTSNVEDMFIPA